MNKEEWIEKYKEDLGEEFSFRGAEDKYGKHPESFNQFCEDVYACEKESLEQEYEANRAIAEKNEQQFSRWKGD